jgi:hypothetical protein
LRVRGACITCDYMAATRVMTLRIDPAMLDELRDVARAEGRSVSGQMIHLVRRDLQARGRVAASSARRRKPLPTYGWLRHLPGPETTVEDVRRLRRSLTRQIEARLRGFPKTT